MRQQGYPGGCRYCREDGLQGSCLHHEVTTPDIENNNLEDFNDLMDVVYLAETKPDDEGARVENHNLNCNPYPNPYP
jgi:hypothetical protein